MPSDKADPFREDADALVAEWMKGCAEPVCAVQDEIRLREMVARALEHRKAES